MVAMTSKKPAMTPEEFHRNIQAIAQASTIITDPTDLKPGTGATFFDALGRHINIICTRPSRITGNPDWDRSGVWDQTTVNGENTGNRRGCRDKVVELMSNALHDAVLTSGLVRPSKSVMFDRQDLGVIADGAFGHQHVRDTMAHMVGVLGYEELQRLLTLEPSDDMHEDYDALEVLNDHVNPELDAAFFFHEGSLVFFEGREEV